MGCRGSLSRPRPPEIEADRGAAAPPTYRPASPNGTAEPGSSAARHATGPVGIKCALVGVPKSARRWQSELRRATWPAAHSPAGADGEPIGQSSPPNRFTTGPIGRRLPLMGAEHPRNGGIAPVESLATCRESRGRLATVGRPPQASRTALPPSAYLRRHGPSRRCAPAPRSRTRLRPWPIGAHTSTSRAGRFGSAPRGAVATGGGRDRVEGQEWPVEKLVQGC